MAEAQDRQARGHGRGRPGARLRPGATPRRRAGSGARPPPGARWEAEAPRGRPCRRGAAGRARPRRRHRRGGSPPPRGRAVGAGVHPPPALEPGNRYPSSPLPGAAGGKPPPPPAPPAKPVKPVKLFGGVSGQPKLVLEYYQHGSGTAVRSVQAYAWERGRRPPARISSGRPRPRRAGPAGRGRCNFHREGNATVAMVPTLPGHCSGEDAPGFGGMACLPVPACCLALFRAAAGCPPGAAALPRPVKPLSPPRPTGICISVLPPVPPGRGSPPGPPPIADGCQRRGGVNRSSMVISGR